MPTPTRTTPSPKNGTIAVLSVDATGAISELDQESLGSNHYVGFVSLDGLLRS
ncbi:hypothetical protein [Kribbella sp. NBC_00359]|uniref:hypothetical protein n=1 Tax=Kribbella sp. NBC_00359 TaxID=2975966 RepID=UPI002E1C1FED